MARIGPSMVEYSLKKSSLKSCQRIYRVSSKSLVSSFNSPSSISLSIARASSTTFSGSMVWLAVENASASVFASTTPEDYGKQVRYARPDNRESEWRDIIEKSLTNLFSSLNL